MSDDLSQMPTGPGMTINSLVATPTTHKAAPNAKATRKPAPKKVAEPATPSKEAHVKRAAKTPASKGSGKKRPLGESAGDDTSSKKSKASDGAGVKKGKAKFPESQAEFSAADWVIYNMRKEGKDWEAITVEYMKVPGTRKPGKDVLRKRFGKLELVGKDWAAGDIARLFDIKAKVEADFEKTKWTNIASRLKEEGIDYKPGACEKKFALLKKKGFVDANGNYTGPDNTTQTLTNSADTNSTSAEPGSPTPAASSDEEDAEDDAGDDTEMEEA